MHTGDHELALCEVTEVVSCLPGRVLYTVNPKPSTPAITKSSLLIGACLPGRVLYTVNQNPKP